MTAPDGARERPILFSAPMVRALLAGTKTQTRRAVKGQALDWLAPDQFTPEFVALPENHLCPYGAPGDRLRVRETFWAFGRWETRFNPKKCRDEWHFFDLTTESERLYLYEPPAGWQKPSRAGATPEWWTRPAIFMPRQASRLLLEVTDVRIERLQDCSASDALAEGIVPLPGLEGFGLADGSHFHAVDPRQSYFALWEAINGSGSVLANPWVWSVTFRRIP